MNQTNKIMPVIEQSKSYHYANEFFNKALFDGKLTRPMLMFTRNKKIIGGYFSPNRWKDEDGNLAHEIAINVNTFINGDVINVFQVLIHEMAHQWQQEFGKPSRSGYHNKEWAIKVIEIGLIPVGEKGTGTGQSVSTKLMDGGAAERAIAALPEKYVFPWYTTPDKLDPDAGVDEGEGEGAKKRVPQSGKRQKYVCSQCGAAVWGKAGLKISHLDCGGTLMVERITNE